MTTCGGCHYISFRKSTQAGAGLCMYALCEAPRLADSPACTTYEPPRAKAPPPPAPQYLAGTRLPAGSSYATVMPDLDFETYSEAGYWWDGPARRWRGITPTDPGLPAVGAAVYTEHPSCVVLTLAYDLKDGRGDRLWTPGMEPPQDLFDHIHAGGLLEAWNSSFEYWVWRNVCNARMGWPALDHRQLRCAMSKARAHSLPGGLDAAAKATGAREQKDAGGKALIRKLCVPRTPSKKQCRELPEPLLLKANHPTPATHPEDYAAIGAYCRQDIKAEAAISLLCPDLSPSELQLWLLDQAINFRGVHIDQVALQDCISIVDQATQQYTLELQMITGGALGSASEIEAMRKWLATQGLQLPNIDADMIKATLKRTDITPLCRRVLEIRDSLGSASVKKLFAIQRRLARNGRLHDLFAFAGADRTARWAGRGPQPQNLPASGPKVCECKGCGRVFWKGLLFCPECNKLRGPDDTCDWGIKAVEACLRDIATRSLAHVERMWGDALAAVAGCLRGLFAAAPGREFICSDYSAIEAVVLAELAGEEWRQEVFRTHGKIYEAGASKITGIPFEEFMDYKKRTGMHHPMRKKVGKVSELACFGADTHVLTGSGWKRIADVAPTDMLHDGAGWVRHGGAVSRGNRLTMKMGGVTVTPDHKVFIGGEKWATAEDLSRDTQLLNRALSMASLLLWTNRAKIPVGSLATSAFAPAGISAATSLATCVGVRAPGVTPALRKKRAKPPACTRLRVLTRHTVGDCSTVSPQLSGAAPTPSTGNTHATGAEVSAFIRPGSKTVESGLSTCAPLTAGTSPLRLLIDSTMTSDTPPAISVLLLIKSSKVISDRRSGLCTTAGSCLPRSSTGNFAPATPTATQSAASSLRVARPRRLLSSKPDAKESTVSEVFDILNCGPRSRFVIMTEYGPMIVHNSGFGGAVGAWKAFGADEFMNDDEIQQNVWAWREASPAIAGRKYARNGKPEVKGFWYGLQDAAFAAIANPGYQYTYQAPATKFTQPPPITYYVHNDILYCVLPSGRQLTYHQPRLEQHTNTFSGRTDLRLTYWGYNTDYKKGPKGWMKLDTFGGKLTENCVQAVARDILANCMPGLEAAGYPIVLHVHDEVVSEVPAGTGDVKEFEAIMGTMPEWAAAWPIKAAGGWRGSRYRKD